MDGSNTQDSVPKCSSDEVLIQVNTDKSDTEVETGNEKTISGIRVISKAKRMVKQISNTLNTQVLHKQYSGTNLGFELSNYYLNEEIFGYVLQYFTEREMHYLSQVSETLQNVILTHPQGWDKKLRKKYFAKLKLERAQATKAKDHFYTVWPRKAFYQLGTKLSTIIWGASYVLLIGVFSTYFFVRSESIVITFGWVALYTVVALFVVYILSPFLFLICYNCRLLPPESTLFRRHPDAIKHRSFDPDCSSACEYYYYCTCHKDQVMGQPLENGCNFTFFFTATLVSVVVAIVGLTSGSYGSDGKEQYTALPYFVPLIYLTTHYLIFYVLYDYGRQMESCVSVCTVVTVSGIMGSTIAMLLTPSIPWQYALLPIYISLIGCFQGLYSAFVVLISCVNCHDVFLNRRDPLNYGEDAPDYFDDKPRCFSASTLFLSIFQCGIFFVIPWILFHFGVIGWTNNVENGILVLTLIVCWPCATWAYVLIDWLGLMEDND